MLNDTYLFGIAMRDKNQHFGRKNVRNEQLQLLPFLSLILLLILHWLYHDYPKMNG